ncbi:hypothetical protein [Saccharicrinis sp. FJH54]|uniref:hypothetical protein n=1 Tax=Saccharicrinis sp. FJH54 TaxID=3344665 RepID=UPI0035D4C1F1
MKKLFCLIVILSIVSVSNTYAQLNTGNAALKYPQADTAFSDTLVKSNYKLFIQPVSRDVYVEKVKGLHYFPSSDSHKLTESFNESAKRLDDSTLVIMLRTGKADTIRNYYPKDINDLEFRSYRYADYIPEIHSHLLTGSYYEASNYVLLNDSTGEMNNQSLFANIAFDPRKQRLITYAWDDFAYASGIFRIYDISEGSLKELMIYYPESDNKDYFWSLSNVYFILHDELLFICQMYNKKTRKRSRFYAKMIMEENRQ